MLEDQIKELRIALEDENMEDTKRLIDQINLFVEVDESNRLVNQVFFGIEDIRFQIDNKCFDYVLDNLKNLAARDSVKEVRQISRVERCPEAQIMIYIQKALKVPTALPSLVFFQRMIGLANLLSPENKRIAMEKINEAIEGGQG